MNYQQLSPHFNLSEFCQSQMAARRGIPIVPGPTEAANLTRLCLTVLEPIRVKLGLPMVITSGYRPPWLNAAIGGASDSAHLYGLAADVQVIGMAPPDFAGWIRNNKFPVDQVIQEFGEWVHIAISSKPPRGEYLIARAPQLGGKTIYSPMT